MDSSIYIALSRQLNQFENMAVTSNNIANATTTGYSAQKLVFNQYLVDSGKTGQKVAYADAPSTWRDTNSGGVKMTNNPFDLAISGTGYFQVQTPLGTRFTKAGNFQIDSNGVLMTNTGYPVLGNDGAQITIPPTAKNVDINGLGQITVDGQALGQVGVVEFANQQAMTRLGNSLYEGQNPLPVTTSRVVQGALESSNVNGVTELVHVMEVSRSVGNTAKFIDAMYELEQKSSAVLSRPKAS